MGTTGVGAVVPVCAALTILVVQPHLRPLQRIVPGAQYLRIRSQSAVPQHEQICRLAEQLKFTLSVGPEPMSALPVAGKNANSMIRIARNAWCICMRFSCCNDNAVNTSDFCSMVFMECSFFQSGVAKMMRVTEIPDTGSGTSSRRFSTEGICRRLTAAAGPAPGNSSAGRSGNGPHSGNHIPGLDTQRIHGARLAPRGSGGQLFVRVLRLMQGFSSGGGSQAELALKRVAATPVDVLDLGRLVEGLVAAHESLI